MITADTHLAYFPDFTPEQLNLKKPVNLSKLTFIMHQHTEGKDIYLNELLKVNNKIDKTEQYWFPTKLKFEKNSTHTMTRYHEINSVPILIGVTLRLPLSNAKKLNKLS